MHTPIVTLEPIYGTERPKFCLALAARGEKKSEKFCKCAERNGRLVYTVNSLRYPLSRGSTPRRSGILR